MMRTRATGPNPSASVACIRLISSRNDPVKSFKFFQRLVAAPYLLALLGLLLPLFNVSCADDVIAEPSFYEVASGLNLEESLKEPALSYLKKMEDGNPAALEKFKAVMPEFPQVQPVHHLYGIAGALVLAAMFAWTCERKIF